MRRLKFIIFTVVLGMILSAVPALAQAPNVVNPRTVQWTPSDDHATITSYEIAYFATATDVTTPIQLTDLGKPTPDAQNVCTATINTQPLPFKVGYVARMRAKVAGTPALYSDWSDPSNFFDRKPGNPKNVIAK